MTGQRDQLGDAEAARDRWRTRAEQAEARIARTLRALDLCGDVKVRDVADSLRNILTGKDT